MSLCALLFTFKDRCISLQEAAMIPVFAMGLCAFLFGFNDRCISLQEAAVMHIFLQWIYVQHSVWFQRHVHFSPATAFVFLSPTRSSRIIAVAMFALLQKQGSRCSSVPAGARKILPTTPGRMWRRRRDNKQEEIRNALFLAVFLR
jgi:hypothetical protein